MEIVFLGTPEFAIPALVALNESDNHRIVGVITQPDRPRGRGKKLSPPPVKVAALEAGLPLHQTAEVNAEETLGWVRERSPLIGVVVAFGQFIKKPLREIPLHGFVNLHASLLPKYRGAAPIHAAILSGDQETGVSIMRVEKRMDAGEVFARASLPIQRDENVGELTTRLAELGADWMVRVMDDIEAGRAVSEPQDESMATHVPRIGREDRRVLWDRPARTIHNQVRGLTPHPGAVSSFRPSRSSEPFAVRITRTSLVSGDKEEVGEPGTVMGVTAGASGRGIRVSVPGGGLRILRLVAAGGRELDGVEFINGRGKGGGRFV